MFLKISHENKSQRDACHTCRIRRRSHDFVSVCETRYVLLRVEIKMQIEEDADVNIALYTSECIYLSLQLSRVLFKRNAIIHVCTDYICIRLLAHSYNG